MPALSAMVSCVLQKGPTISLRTCILSATPSSVVDLRRWRRIRVRAELVGRDLAVQLGCSRGCPVLSRAVRVSPILCLTSHPGLSRPEFFFGFCCLVGSQLTARRRSAFPPQGAQQFARARTSDRPPRRTASHCRRDASRFGRFRSELGRNSHLYYRCRLPAVRFQRLELRRRRSPRHGSAAVLRWS